MAMYGGLCCPNHERKGKARMCDDESVAKLNYEEPWVNHFDYALCQQQQ